MDYISQAFIGIGVSTFISQVVYKLVEKGVSTLREKLTAESVSDCIFSTCTFLCKLCQRKVNPYEHYLPNNLTVELKSFLLTMGESLHQRVKKTVGANEHIGDSAYYVFPSMDVKIKNLLENPVVNIIGKNRETNFIQQLALLHDTIFKVLLDENDGRNEFSRKLQTWLRSGKIKIRQSIETRTTQIYIGDYDNTGFIPLVLVEICDKSNKLSIAQKSILHKIASECRSKRKKTNGENSNSNDQPIDLSLTGKLDLHHVVINE